MQQMGAGGRGVKSQKALFPFGIRANRALLVVRRARWYHDSAPFYRLKHTCEQGHFPTWCRTLFGFRCIRRRRHKTIQWSEDIDAHLSFTISDTAESLVVVVHVQNA